MRCEQGELKNRAASMRKSCLEMGLAAGGYGAHMGGALSAIEIVATLFFRIMRYQDRPYIPYDELIFSKGHGVLAQYAALVELGVIEPEELKTFKQPGSRLTAHPAVDKTLGIDYATGSLGQGLSLGIGQALANKRLGMDARTFVILGDGECDEGSVWEAALMASQFNVDNIVAIVDENGLQFDASTTEVISLGNLASKWDSFGWDVREVDGHDFTQLEEALSELRDRPRAVIARTVKGKGISFMENQPSWHNNVVSRKLYEQAMRELD